MKAKLAGGWAWLAASVAVCVAQDKPAANQTEPTPHPADPTIREVTSGFTFTVHPDGRVELKVTESRDGKTSEKLYQADSLEEFKNEYPQIAEEYQIDRLTGRRLSDSLEVAPSPEDFQNWKKLFEEDWFWDKNEPLIEKWRDGFDSQELDRWIDKQRRLFEEFRALPAPQDRRELRADSPDFGILIGSIDEAMASHLQLDPQRSLLVLRVIPGSKAEKAGIQRHDIIVKLNGQELSDRATFRADLHNVMSSVFTLEVMRKGKHETIRVSPANS